VKDGPSTPQRFGLLDFSAFAENDSGELVTKCFHSTGIRSNYERKMILNDELYRTQDSKFFSSIIRETSERLIAREYNLIPCSNMKEPIEPGWRGAMDAMLDHYFLKLLPWESGHPSTSVLFENEEFSIVEAWFRQDNGGVMEDGDIVMEFKFYKDGKVDFEGIKY
jgi:hypothetical protein